jgi:hypothetical protein
LTLKTTVWLSISTPAVERENFFTNMLKSGKIKTLEISLVCESCRREGEVKICKHRANAIPSWSSEDRRAFLQSLYPAEKLNQYARENLGIDIERGPECFPFMRVEEIFAQPRLPLPQRNIRHVFVAIDPCGGSDIREQRGSDYAICSIVSPGALVLGMEAMDIYDPGMQVDDRILLHIRRIVTLLPQAIIVVAIENLTGREHETQAYAIMKAFPGRIVIMREKLQKTGVNTTHQVKAVMMQLTRASMVAGEIALFDNLITTHAKPDEMLGEFKQQLLRYREVKQPSETPFGRGKIAWTGKTGVGVRDDLAVCLQLAIYWRSVFLADSAKYMAYL